MVSSSSYLTIIDRPGWFVFLKHNMVHRKLYV